MRGETEIYNIFKDLGRLDTGCMFYLPEEIEIDVIVSKYGWLFLVELIKLFTISVAYIWNSLSRRAVEP